MRSLACLVVLLSCSGCALGAAGIAADVVAGASVATLAVSGKGLGDQAISAAAGQDCRLLEGMVRSDRGICEAYRTAALQRTPYLIKTNPPPMPEINVGQPMMAQPAMLRVAAPVAPAAAAQRPADLPPPAQPLLAAAKEEVEPASPPAKAPAAAEAAKPPPAPEKAAVVMEAEDSMKLNFGDGRSDAAVLAQLQAAIATWRQEVDQPAPVAPPPPTEHAEP